MRNKIMGDINISNSRFTKKIKVYIFCDENLLNIIPRVMWVANRRKSKKAKNKCINKKDNLKIIFFLFE